MALACMIARFGAQSRIVYSDLIPVLVIKVNVWIAIVVVMKFAIFVFELFRIFYLLLALLKYHPLIINYLHISKG